MIDAPAFTERSSSDMLAAFNPRRVGPSGRGWVSTGQARPLIDGGREAAPF